MPDELEEAPLAFQLISMSDRPWAMSRSALRSLAAGCGQFDLDAVAARMGQPLEEARGVTNYGGTALLNIRGPLFRYRSIWTWLLGGTSVEETALALHAALDDPTVHRLVLAVNSPGGQIDGINALANMIRAGNRTKPITAYVDGLAASGAYWLASAAGRIVTDETAQLGSIGVLATVIDDREAEEKRGVKRYEIVSSQSPLKRTDPGTDEGRMQLQQMVDAMASLFIQKVAQFRGTSEAKVAGDFGRGAVLPARDAVSVGMADAVGSLEELLGAGDGDPVRVIRDQPGLRVGRTSTGGKRELAAGSSQSPSALVAGTVDEEKECGCPTGEECDCEEEEETDQPLAAGATSTEGDTMTPTADRQRIAAILTCEEARGREELARLLALETDHPLEAVQKYLLVTPVAVKPENALEARMAALGNPKVGIGHEPEQGDDNQREVAAILAFVPKNRRHTVQ